MKSSDNIFSLMIISADNYMTRPISGLDPCYSEFRSFEIKQVCLFTVIFLKIEKYKTFFVHRSRS